VAALEPGIYVYDLWADEGKTVAISTTLRPEMGCSSIHHTSVAESATECGGIYYDNPIFPSSPDPLASRQAEIEEAKASTTERPLTTPHTSMPETNLNKRGFARARVADATRDLRVADGTNLDLGVGYGFDIIGLERGEATRLIADLTKLDPSNTINPGGVWDSLKKWVVKFGPERVRGAIVDMQLKQRSGKLDIPAMRALPSFAGAFQSAQAASERIAAVSAPDGAVRRVSRLDMFGLRK
jgi:hypothetical protein